MRFISIDVETANPDMQSICSIGAATFENGSLVDEWYSLVDPEDIFDSVNTSIHGITENDVRGAPLFEEISHELGSMLNGQIVVTHTHFDRTAIALASRAFEVEAPRCRWLDSSRVARRAWPECAHRGYGLSALAKRIGFDFRHHNALEDAKAAGNIMLAAMNDTGLDLDAWIERVTAPINPSTSEPIRREGSADGALFGEVIVFTGALEIPRREAADLAAKAGCDVATGVTKKISLLVVGDTDVGKLAGHEKSNKHRKAEALIAKGQPIRIIRETDFKNMIDLAE